MQTCRNCGAENPSHLITTFTEGGNPLKVPLDRCSQCDPSLATVQPKLELVPNWVANPEEYDTLEYVEDGERVPIIKDWARGEFEQRIVDAPVASSELEKAKEAKRAFARERNKRPMTEAEVQRTVNAVREQFEMATRVMGAEAAGVILP